MDFSQYRARKERGTLELINVEGVHYLITREFDTKLGTLSDVSKEIVTKQEVFDYWDRLEADIAELQLDKEAFLADFQGGKP